MCNERGKDEEDAVHATYNGAFLNHEKKSKIMPFAATQMDLETVILSEISQTRKIHNTAYT